MHHALGERGGGIADVDLAAGDVVAAAIERRRFGEAGHRMLGRGVGDRARARRVRGDRAVVDDAAAARFLRLHDLDRFLRAQKHAGEIGVDNLLPRLAGQILERHRGSADARIVEKHVQPAEGILGLGEQRFDCRRIGDVGRHDKAFRAARVCPFAARPIP